MAPYTMGVDWGKEGTNSTTVYVICRNRSCDYDEMVEPMKAPFMSPGEPRIRYRGQGQGQRQGEYMYKRLRGWTKDEYRAARKARHAQAKKQRRITNHAKKARQRAYARQFHRRK